MAAALLGVALGDRDEPVTVTSAGLLEGGRSIPPEVATVIAPFGADLSGHHSTRLTPAAIEEADLILCMERRHGREVALLVPTAWPRTFAFKDLIRRGEKTGPRRPDQSIEEWLEAVGDQRGRNDLAGRSPDDDVADPIGGSLRRYRASAAELDDLVQRLTRLLWSDAGTADS
jgi:protein-tyrosine phosphatase